MSVPVGSAQYPEVGRRGQSIGEAIKVSERCASHNHTRTYYELERDLEALLAFL